MARKAKPAKPQHDKETFSWLGKAHEAYQMIVELLKTHFTPKLGIGDVRPVLRSPGKPVTWKAKLVTIPACVRGIMGEGHTNRVALIDRDWWDRSNSRERQGVLHALLAQAAKEEKIVVYASAVAAHGAYTQMLEDVVQHGYRQLKLQLHEAEEAFGIEPEPEPEKEAVAV